MSLPNFHHLSSVLLLFVLNVSKGRLNFIHYYSHIIDGCEILSVPYSLDDPIGDLYWPSSQLKHSGHASPRLRNRPAGCCVSSRNNQSLVAKRVLSVVYLKQQHCTQPAAIRSRFCTRFLTSKYPWNYALLHSPLKISLHLGWFVSLQGSDPKVEFAHIQDAHLLRVVKGGLNPRP